MNEGVRGAFTSGNSSAYCGAGSAGPWHDGGLTTAMKGCLPAYLMGEDVGMEGVGMAGRE